MDHGQESRLRTVIRNKTLEQQNRKRMTILEMRDGVLTGCLTPTVKRTIQRPTPEIYRQQPDEQAKMTSTVIRSICRRRGFLWQERVLASHHHHVMNALKTATTIQPYASTSKGEHLRYFGWIQIRFYLGNSYLIFEQKWSMQSTVWSA
jgi:hypothetical protein